jgi:hypothetical protein
VSFPYGPLSISGMDDLFLKRVLFEWLRDRRKEEVHAEIASLKEIIDPTVNSLILQRLVSVLSLRALVMSSRGLKKDCPWSDDLEKLPASSIINKKGGILQMPPLVKTVSVIFYANPATSSFIVTAILNRAVNTRKPMAHIPMAIRISGNVGTYSCTR